MSYSNDIVAIEIEETDPSEIEDLLDALYIKGFLTEEGYAPTFEEIDEDYIDAFGTSPSVLLCYKNEQGEPVLAPGDWSSHKTQRLLEDASVIDIEEGRRYFAD